MAKSNSTNNFLPHLPSSSQISGDDRSPEESGWTIYFEDFLNSSNHHGDQLSSFSSSDVALDDQTHVVPDAASSVVGDNEGGAAVAPGLSYMNVSKKRKMMMIKELLVEDESLEDTASSPVNSPKVYDSTYFSKNQKHEENLIITPQVEERSREMGFVGMGSDYTQLKKRGLCLVPLSMVVNYLAE